MPTDLCPNKSECGSCAWSHIPYDKQLQQKLSDINGSFALKKLDLRVSEILPAPKTSHYRNRMDFVINYQGAMGLRAKGKWWKTIDNHTCFLADTNIEKLFHITRNWLPQSGLTYYDRKTNTGLLRYAVIRSTTTGQSMLTIITSAPQNPTEAATIKTALTKLAATTQPTSLVWSINHHLSDISTGDELHTITGPGYIEETIGGKTFRITPNAFFQTNTYGAALLQKTVMEFAGDLAQKTLLDLYCGSGFFAISLAAPTNPQAPNQKTATHTRPKTTIGIELVPEAIKDARINAQLNNVAQTITFHDAKAEDYDWTTFKADTVILDPPRSGMHDKTLQDILAAKPATIIYISCNYKNFAREMLQLQSIYEIKKMRAIDMFPHTPHVELVSLLIRRAT